LDGEVVGGADSATAIARIPSTKSSQGNETRMEHACRKRETMANGINSSNLVPELN
jgi:hypothetical protein